MTSFISALSLFILVLSNVCFTLPILNQQLWSSTYSSINDDVTTGETLNLRLVADNETSMLPDFDKKQATDEHIGFEMSTSINGLSEEKTIQALRSFDQFSTTEQSFTEDYSFTTVEPTAFPTQQTPLEKLEDEHSLLSSSEPMTFTTEQSYDHKRHHEDLQFSTIEPATEQSYHENRENEDLVLSTSESSDNDEHNHHDLSLTSVEPTTQVAEFDRRSFNGEFETENGTEETQVELTTNNMPSSTSSFVPKISTSTEKYIGHLKHKNEYDDEYPEERSTEYMKIQKKPWEYPKTGSWKKSNMNSEEGNLQESSVPTAIFDQKALDKVANIPSDFLVLDENNDLVVTDLPEKIFPSTMAYKEKESLNQGEESSHSEEKESNH